MSFAIVDKFIQPLKKPASMEDEGEASFFFHPTLYVIPSVEPRRSSSPSPSSPSSSPYVVNFKWRGPVQNASVQNHADEDDDVRCQDRSEAQSSIVNADSMSVLAQVEAMEKGMGERKPSHDVSCSGYVTKMEASIDAAIDGKVEEDDGNNEEALIASDVSDLEPRMHDSMVATIAQRMKMSPHLTLNDGTRSVTGLEFLASPQASTCEEFYDAPEAPLEDSANEQVATSGILMSKRLGMSAQELVHSLQDEVARRIKAEEALALLQLHWSEAVQRCASMGISMTTHEYTLNSVRANTYGVYEHISERLAVARVVAGAVASAAVKAAKDEEMERNLASKNWEISRLWDKLQYVELVNREMSQRNQEIIEIEQRRRRRRKRKQKWIIGFFCSAFCIGTAGLLCYKLSPWDQTGTWNKALKISARD